jgi:hypothetical protein
MARVLQNRKANANEKNGWKEVTERVGSEVHNSRDLEKNRNYQTKSFKPINKIKRRS